MELEKRINLLMATISSSTRYEDVVCLLFGIETKAPYNHTITTMIPEISARLNTGLIPNETGIEYSVVIPTYNRKKSLMRAIKSLMRQTEFEKSSYEIIVVDDCSADGTADEMRSFMAGRDSGPAIAYFKLSKNSGPAIARNLGIINARGSYVAFTDDDCAVPPDWLSNFKKAFKKHPELAGAGGWKELGAKEDIMKTDIYERFLFWKKHPNMQREWRSETFDLFNQCGDTANVCYQKKILLDLEGFNPFMRRFGHWELKVRIHKKRLPLLYHLNHVRHFSEKNLKDFIHTWLKSGWGFYLVSLIHPDFYRYKYSFKRALDGIKRDARRLFFDPDNTPYMAGGDRLIFFILAVWANMLLWLGRYRP